MTIVNRHALDPTQITESKVFCYSADTCKDAKTLVPLLRDQEAIICSASADTSSRAEDNSSDEATMLYNAKVIRVVLLDPKQSQTNRRRLAVASGFTRRVMRTIAHHFRAPREERV